MSAPPILAQRLGRFALVRPGPRSHWPPGLRHLYCSLTVAQFFQALGRAVLILGFQRRHSRGSGDPSSYKRKPAHLTTFQYSRDCIGNVGVGACFAIGGGAALCSPVPELWFLPPRSLWGTLGEPIPGTQGGGTELDPLGGGWSLGLGGELGPGTPSLEAGVGGSWVQCTYLPTS